MENKKIAIIGAGNLGQSIAKGLIDKKFEIPQNITLTKRDTSSLDSFSKNGFVVTSDNRKAVRLANIILLCVQPNQLKGIFEEISGLITEKQVVISVITGISIKEISDELEKDVCVVRAMPNTAIAIGESMTCIASSKKEALKITIDLFNTMGKSLVIEEELMQAATVLGASGIAFFMRYIRAATQGGVQMGFDSDEAQLIALQTAKGAASLVMELDSHPEVEIDKVTTPQGCTIEGLNEMEHKGFSSALIQGIMTSFNRITAMKKA